jgi:hypothetical protein
MSYPAQINQALYFARLHIESAEQLQAEQGGRFSRQILQCHSDAAVEQLYRSLYFIALLLLSNTSLANQLQLNPQMLNRVIKQAANEQQAPLVNQLAHMLAGTGELAELPQWYLARWKIATTRVDPSPDLLHSDKLSTLEQCQRWHLLLSDLNASIAEQSIEY